MRCKAGNSLPNSWKCSKVFHVRNEDGHVLMGFFSLTPQGCHPELIFLASEVLVVCITEKICTRILRRRVLAYHLVSQFELGFWDAVYKHI